MTTIDLDINQIPNVRRIENCSKDEIKYIGLELTHSVYPHEEIYGPYCTIEEYINVPPETVYAYLKDVYNLEEWTYSLRGFEPVAKGSRGAPGELMVSFDKMGENTRIYTRVAACDAAMTVDYHCAWDQPDKLWMIYLMRVVPAKLVLDKPGSVVLWTNCHHPFYDKNPYPEKSPSGRKVWVGDFWTYFYAGHTVELTNLKHILEHRYPNGAIAHDGPRDSSDSSDALAATKNDVVTSVGDGAAQ